jgi:hypothetical protein
MRVRHCFWKDPEFKFDAEIQSFRILKWHSPVIFPITSISPLSDTSNLLAATENTVFC